MLDQIDNVYSYNENVMLMGDLKNDYKLDESVSSNPLLGESIYDQKAPNPKQIDTKGSLMDSGRICRIK